MRIAALLLFTTLLLSACGRNMPGASTDHYDISRMDLKPTPAQLSNERHSGPFSAGTALSMTAELKPLDPSPIKDVRLDTHHKIIEIAPGVKFSAWTFGDQVPGPTVRARVGDRIRFSMTNRSDETLPAAPESAGIHDAHSAGLGGFRHAAAESPNFGWRNASFRGYADYMQTEEFAQNLASLMDLTRQERVALMCAEAVPWRCHRSLIVDALVVHDLRVDEIINRTHCQIHALTPFAKVNGMAQLPTRLRRPQSLALPSIANRRSQYAE